MEKAIRWGLILLMLVAVLGCARNPVTGRREIVLVSESEEIAMGLQADGQAREEYGVVEDPRLQNYLQAVGQKLAAVSHRPNLEWHFTVVDSPIVNAFAIPGGYVYFTRGILAHLNSEAELAGIMGHEIGHVTARHSVRQITRAQLAQLGLGAGQILSPAFGQFSGLAEQSVGLLFLRFSREDERESDRLGVEYSARGAYDPREVSNFFEVLGRMSAASDRQTIPGWLSTHPDPPERVQATRGYASEWIASLELTEERMVVNRDNHLRSIDGMVFGDNPREGFAEGGRFFHPELQLQIVFPQAWRIENTKSAVIALDPQQGAQMQLTLVDAPQGTTAAEYVRNLAARGTVPESARDLNVNGNRAVLALYQIPAEGRTLAGMGAFIEFRNRLIQILGVTADAQRFFPIMEESMRSLDRLTDQRILQSQPDRLRLYTARAGDTLTAIAARLNNPRVDADQLAILNRVAVNQAITPGRQLKTVERGY